jgi:hypothetical protein
MKLIASLILILLMFLLGSPAELFANNFNGLSQAKIVGPNCFNTVLRLSNSATSIRHVTEEEINSIINAKNCLIVDSYDKIKNGDISLIYYTNLINNQTETMHGFYWQSPEMIIEKGSYLADSKIERTYINKEIFESCPGFYNCKKDIIEIKTVIYRCRNLQESKENEITQINNLLSAINTQVNQNNCSSTFSKLNDLISKIDSRIFTNKSNLFWASSIATQLNLYLMEDVYGQLDGKEPVFSSCHKEIYRSTLAFQNLLASQLAAIKDRELLIRLLPATSSYFLKRDFSDSEIKSNLNSFLRYFSNDIYNKYYIDNLSKLTQHWEQIDPYFSGKDWLQQNTQTKKVFCSIYDCK